MVAPYFQVEDMLQAGELANGFDGTVPMVRGNDGRPAETQTSQGDHHAQQIRNPPALGAGSQSAGGLLFLPAAQGFHKKRRVRCHPLAADDRGGLVVGKNRDQIPGGDVLSSDPTAERGGMIGVGARQGAGSRDAAQLERHPALTSWRISSGRVSRRLLCQSCKPRYRQELTIKTRCLKKTGYYASDGRQVFQMVLQNVVHDGAINIKVVVDKGVSKTDHAEPFLR